MFNVQLLNRESFKRNCDCMNSENMVKKNKRFVIWLEDRHSHFCKTTYTDNVADIFKWMHSDQVDGFLVSAVCGLHARNDIDIFCS